MSAKEMLAPVPAASDYSVSAELWGRLESEVKRVSEQIDISGDTLTPDDVSNVYKLKKQVDSYVTSFNKAMRDAQSKYRGMVDHELKAIGFDKIETFVAGKRKEQTDIQNGRIAYKMGSLQNLCEGLLEKTVKLKDTLVAKELLSVFTARFPKVQSGAANNEIKDWKPYFSIISHTMTVMDTFFCDPKYEDAIHLPIYSGTMRELLAYAKDGDNAHLVNVPSRYKEDQHFIHEAKLKEAIKTKADGIDRIRAILDDLDGAESGNESVRVMRTEQAWSEIALVVRLINNP